MTMRIVVWRHKPEARGNDKAINAHLIKGKLEALQGQIPRLLALEVGIDTSTTPSSSDVSPYSEFASQDAMADYPA
jgi:hypothetical protein